MTPQVAQQMAEAPQSTPIEMSSPRTPASSNNHEPQAVPPSPLSLLNANSNANANANANGTLQWSKYLATDPSPLTTPSLETSYHGLGLSVAHSRSKALTTCGKSRSDLLDHLSSETSSLSTKILKSSSVLSKSLSQIMDQQSYNLTTLTPDPLLLQFSNSLTSFSKQNQFLSITVRSSCVRPLHTESISHGVNSEKAYEEYQKARKACQRARHVALKAKVKYNKCCEEAQTGINDVVKQSSRKNSIETTSPDNHADSSNSGLLSMLTSDSQTKSVKTLYSSLSSVRSSETSYRLSVEDDNSSTTSCTLIEKSSLSTLESLEGDRLLSFVQNLSRLVLAESGALQNMRAAIDRVSTSSDPVLPILPSSTAFKGYENIESEGALKSTPSKQTSSTISPLVLSEGDASNLPKMVSQLRSDLLRFQSRGLAAVQALNAVRMSLNEISKAVESFRRSLGDFLNNSGYPCGDSKTLPAIENTLAVMISKAEGQLSFKAWSCVASSISSQVRQASVLFKSLEKLLNEEGAMTQQYINEEAAFFKNVKEGMDREWKGICEQGKLQGKAENRYKIAETTLNASKERLETVQKELSTQSASPHAPDQPSSEGENFVGVRKAIGHVLNSLGTGDETISKVVSTKERMEMVEAQHSKAQAQLTEASKHLEEVTSRGGERLKTYVNHFEATFKMLSTKESEISERARAGLSSVQDALKKFLDGREKSIKEAADMVDKIQSSDVLNDKLTWARKMEKKIKKKNSQASAAKLKDGDGSASEPDDTSVYDLKVCLHTSQKIYALLKNIFDYNPEDFETRELTESEATEVKLLTELLEQVKTEEELEEKKNAATSKQKEQMKFESNFEGMFLEVGADVEEKKGEDDDDNAEGSEKSDTDDNDNNSNNDDNNEDISEAVLETTTTAAAASATAAVPTVIESFSCAYWPQSDDDTNLPSPLLHGRMFVTAAGLYFVGWGKFKLILEIERIVETKKESTLAGTVDNALLLVCEDGKEYFFGSFAFRENCHRLIDRLRSVKGALIDAGMVLPSNAKKKKENEVSEDDSDNDDDDAIDDVAPVPFTPCSLAPDAHVKKMTVVVSDTLKGFNIQQYFNTFWRDRAGGEMFYGPWLEEKGAKKVGVTKWEAKKQHEHKYSKETFNMKRVATFDYPRTTHLWMGPPMAGVTQTQYCRIDEGSRCVVAMTVEMNGIPYADVFAVEVRWVATNVADKVIEVEVGVAVDFKKSSMFKGQIKSGTEEETGSIHRSLFESMKTKVGETAVDPDTGDADSNRTQPSVVNVASPPPKSATARSFQMEEKMVVLVLLFAFLLLFYDLRQQKFLVRDLIENSKTLQDEIGLLVKALQQQRN
ncbi:hypothetical protein TrST_g6221 [Triparma strigata]|nr:hypothetical protein TrST_g6221 [Triparma strigata]